MPNFRTVTLPLTADERRRWTEAARREGLTLRQWLRAACELAWVRGGTR